MKTKYLVEFNIHNQNNWNAIHTCSSLKEATKEFNRYVKNTKGDPVCIEINHKLRIRKLTEEILTVVVA